MLVSLCLVLAFGAVACGDDAPSEYSESIRAAFMRGCVEDDTNEDLIEVCECTYDTAVKEMPFDQFRTAERRLQEGSPEVSSEFSDIILGCIRRVSGQR